MTLRLVHLKVETMLALLAGDLAGASAQAGVRLTDYFVGEQSIWLWRYRVDQIRRDPSTTGWLARAVVIEETGQVIGHAGYHGPPDADGMVEVGYSVDPQFRRRGHAREILGELLRRAKDEPAVRTVRASISRTTSGRWPRWPGTDSFRSVSSGTRRTGWSWSSSSRRDSAVDSDRSESQI